MPLPRLAQNDDLFNAPRHKKKRRQKPAPYSELKDQSLGFRIAAWAAASLAIGTRNGEHET